MAPSTRKTTDAVPKDRRANLRVGGGRPKGVPNKTTKLAKEAIALAAEGLGGTARLIAWAQESDENERIFWQSMYTKLIPVQVTGEDGGAIKVEAITRTICDPKAP